MAEQPTQPDDTLPEDIHAMSFEDALGELEGIVRKLEAGQVSLEDSIEIYTRGTHLKRLCDAKLKDAETRIRKITQNEDGSLSASALDVD
ncbi:MAG: exodeoxyribonuclease VII small subunit [Sphingomonadales bacterium]